jgi:hypothetical protein
MEDGWIKLHRKMREWQHYQRPSVRLVFEEVLFCANTKPGWFHGIKVNRGETIVSIETICGYTGFARATVVAALKILEDTKEIKRSKCWRGTRTKIINFDKYQDNVSSESSSKTELQTELLIEPQTELQTELLIEPKQEVKKDKKEKNNIDANASSSGAAAPDPDLSSQESVDFVGLIKFFNRTMDEAGAIIPRCKSCDGKRREFVRARIREHGLDAVYEMITKASQSDFLNGKSRSGWIADFTWLFRPSNFQKVLEGNYDNRTNNFNGTNTNQSSGGCNPKNTVTGFVVHRAKN